MPNKILNCFKVHGRLIVSWDFIQKWNKLVQMEFSQSVEFSVMILKFNKLNMPFCRNLVHIGWFKLRKHYNSLDEWDDLAKHKICIIFLITSPHVINKCFVIGQKFQRSNVNGLRVAHWIHCQFTTNNSNITLNECPVWKYSVTQLYE